MPAIAALIAVLEIAAISARSLRRGATLLGIESQASSLAAAVWAPFIGWLIARLQAGVAISPVTAL